MNKCKLKIVRFHNIEICHSKNEKNKDLILF